MKVKLRKLDSKGKPAMHNGAEIIAEYPTVSADKMSKSKYWEIYEDPRDSKGEPKPSRKKEKLELKSENQSEKSDTNVE